MVYRLYSNQTFSTDHAKVAHVYMVTHCEIFQLSQQVGCHSTNVKTGHLQVRLKYSYY